jgi:dolichol-phosphate mannosyltransferase
MSLELSIVIPAYKEAAALTKLLPSLKPRVAGLTDAYEILVVDAQQPVDETAAVCRTNAVGHVFRRYGNLYGDAVRTGIEEAGGRYIVFMDADGSHNPAHLKLLWDQRERHDVVIGSRYVAGGHTENPAILIFMSWVVNVIFRLVFQLHCKDVSNSFRLYRAELLKPLRLQCHHFDIVEELLILLSHRRILEVPVTFERRKAGESKRKLLLFAISYVWTLIRLLKIKIEAHRIEEHR